MDATDTTASATDPRLAEVGSLVRTLRDRIETVVVGQDHMVSRLLVGLLTGGHVLLEGVPGLAKTLTVTTLARAIHAEFSRIQFTPDLLPADLIGTLIYDPRDHSFTPRKGPIFANIVLADEINRAPAKVQSALLEAMQERHATIGDTTHPIPDPFLVLATQNPIEQEGTYPLPEAQVDRFMLKLRVTYPSKAQERAIVDRMASSAPALEIEPVATLEQIATARTAVDSVFVDDRIKDYVVEIVHATRDPSGLGSKRDLARLIEFGASPRASISLIKASRAFALLEGRDFVTPADIKAIGLDVLRHRVIPSYEAEAEGLTSEDLVTEIFDRVRVP
ncbi:MAG: AAA family ATPase [Phycisphaerales bacterium JB040]